MKKVALVSPLRTAVGSFNKTLAPLSAPELGAIVMTACLQQSKLEPSLIDQIYWEMFFRRAMAKILPDRRH